MEMNLNDLDYDDLEEGIEDGSDPSNNTGNEGDYLPVDQGDTYNNLDDMDDDYGQTQETQDDDLVISILRSKGINPEAIKFVNEKGETEEVAFNSLSREDQLDLISYDNNELDQDEIDLLNDLRNNNLTVQDYLEAHRRQAVQDYLDSLDNEPVYQVDNMTDDELFIADLKATVPEATEDEVMAQLNLEKQNDALFNKKVSGLRTTYKQREDAINKEAQDNLNAEQQKAAEAFENLIVEAVQANETIDLGDSSLTLSEDDMNQIASFILDEDSAGIRHIVKALNDPQMLVQMAWFALKGQEAMHQISEYYKKEITDRGKSAYQKGYEDGKSGKQPAKKSVVRKPTTGSTPLTINDLD